MKVIALDFYYLPDKTSVRSRDRFYIVNLGDCGTFSFRRSLHIKAYLVAVSRELNKCLWEINENYIQAFIMYRQLWPYLENNSSGMDTKIHSAQILHGIERGLDLCTKHHGHNQGVFTVKQLNNVLDLLAQWWGLMGKVMEKRSDFSGVYRCSVYSNQAEEIRQRMLQVGRKEYEPYKEDGKQ